MRHKLLLLLLLSIRVVACRLHLEWLRLRLEVLLLVRRHRRRRTCRLHGVRRSRGSCSRAGSPTVRAAAISLWSTRGWVLTRSGFADISVLVAVISPVE